MRSSYSNSFAMNVAVLVVAVAISTTTIAEDRTLQPYPSEFMPKAISSTLLDIEYTGERFIVAGDRGHVLTSTDGNEWNQVNIPVRAMLTRIRMLDNKIGWIVGHDATVLGTRDGGLSWKLLHFDAEWGKPFYDVLFLDENRGFVIGSNGRAIHTTDGGESWTEPEGSIFDLGLHMNGIIKLGSGTLFIVGERSLLARSTDNGENWDLISSPYSGSFFGVLPYGDNGIVTFGLRGNTYIAEDVSILTTENLDEWDEYGIVTQTDSEALSAMGWRIVDNPVVQSLFGGITYDGNLVLVGVNGTVVKGRLESGKLSVVNSGVDAPLSDAVLVNNKLYVVGRNGVDTINW